MHEPTGIAHYSNITKRVWNNSCHKNFLHYIPQSQKIWDLHLTILIQTQFCYKVAITLHIIVPCQFVNFPMSWELWATVPLWQNTHNTENYLHNKKEKRKIPTLSTLSFVLADVSTYGTPHFCALALASARDTFLFSSKSLLFPTRRNGMFPSFFTRRIWSL